MLPHQLSSWWAESEIWSRKRNKVESVKSFILRKIVNTLILNIASDTYKLLYKEYWRSDSFIIFPLYITIFWLTSGISSFASFDNFDSNQKHAASSNSKRIFQFSILYAHCLWLTVICGNLQIESFNIIDHYLISKIRKNNLTIFEHCYLLFSCTVYCDAKSADSIKSNYKNNSSISQQ